MANNLQYRRTHKAIIQGFLAVSASKRFESITVQDIMDEALVSRYTFYKHFQDKYAIAELLQEQLIQDFSAMMDRVRRESSSGRMDQLTQNAAWCRFAQEHREFLALWDIHTETVDLSRRFRELFRNGYLEQNSPDADAPYRELEADICASVQATLMAHFAAEPNLHVNALGEPIRDALINACIYLARLEPGEQVRKALLPFCSHGAANGGASNRSGASE